MLVLSRKINESIIIGNRLITIKVLENKDGIVRLGIDAPRDLSVHREEVFNKIAENNEHKSKVYSFAETGGYLDEAWDVLYYSPSAFNLYNYLLDALITYRKITWDYTASDFLKAFNESLETVHNMIDELIKTGFLVENEKRPLGVIYDNKRYGFVAALSNSQSLKAAS